MNYNHFIQLLENRRSIRKFTSQPVSKDEVKKIIKAGRLAPSGFNSQPWEFVVIQDDDLRKEVVRYLQAAIKGVDPDTIEANMSLSFATAPTLIIIYGDSKVRDFGLPHIKNIDKAWEFTLNTTLAACTQQMHLAVKSLGLGSMWVSAVRKEGVDQRIRQLLHIPDDLILFEMMAVGYPAIEPKKKKLREEEEMIHWDKQSMNNYRTYEDVKAFFDK